MPDDFLGIPIMPDDVAARSTMEGWVIGLLATGYEKVTDLQLPSGNVLTVYCNEAEAKSVVLGTMKNGEWMAFYPRCGFWSGKYHEGKTDIPADEWIEKTPEQLRDEFIEKLKGGPSA